MYKIILSILSLFLLSFLSAFAATDITQELDWNGWTLKLNDSITLDYDEDTFNESVILSARTVSQLEWDLDTEAYEDKWFEVIYVSIKNNIWLSADLSKPVSLAVNNLNQFDNPILVTFESWVLKTFPWDNQWGTYVFTLLDSIDSAYTIVDNLSWESSSNWTTSIFDEEIELNSAPEEPTEANKVDDETSTTVALSDKPVKWSNNLTLILSFLLLAVISVMCFLWYRYS